MESKCCNAALVCEHGYVACAGCGCVARRELDTNVVTYQQCGAYSFSAYTRKNRFCRKIVGSLLGRVGHAIDVDLLNDIKRTGASTPEGFLEAIAKHKTICRRPYIHVTRYWEATGRSLPTMSDFEVKFLERMFDNLFFAWARLGLPDPQFPYTTLLQLIVHHFQLSENAHFLIRFTRRLRCAKRRVRYALLFEKCVAYVANHGERY